LISRAGYRRNATLRILVVLKRKPVTRRFALRTNSIVTLPPPTWNTSLVRGSRTAGAE
jgi:hypothetical protein